MTVESRVETLLIIWGVVGGFWAFLVEFRDALAVLAGSAAAAALALFRFRTPEVAPPGDGAGYLHDAERARGERIGPAAALGPSTATKACTQPVASPGTASARRPPRAAPDQLGSMEREDVDARQGGACRIPRAAPDQPGSMEREDVDTRQGGACRIPRAAPGQSGSMEREDVDARQGEA